MEKETWHRITLSSTVVTFLLLSYSLLVIASTPVTSYELSIYSQTPAIFWVAVLSGLLNGLFLISLQIYLGENRRMWILGLFEAVFCNCLVISLYALRGYVSYLGRGDVSTYIGYAKDINDYGHFGDNFHPVTSILISQLSQLANFSVTSVSKFVPSFFFAIYVLSIYCWSKSTISDRRFVMSSVMASTPVFFAWFSTSIYHQVLSVWTLPLFFYLLQRNSDYRFRVFCIIFSIIYPFFHPITGLVFFLYLLVWFLSERFIDVSATKIKNVSGSLLLVSFAGLVAWFIQQYALLRSIRLISNHSSFCRILFT
jgi:hypothetical protein